MAQHIKGFNNWAHKGKDKIAREGKKFPPSNLLGCWEIISSKTLNTCLGIAVVDGGGAGSQTTSTNRCRSCINNIIDFIELFGRIQSKVHLITNKMQVFIMIHLQMGEITSLDKVLVLAVSSHDACQCLPSISSLLGSCEHSLGFDPSILLGIGTGGAGVVLHGNGSLYSVTELEVIYPECLQLKSQHDPPYNEVMAS